MQPTNALEAAVQAIIVAVFVAPFIYWLSLRRKLMMLKQPPVTGLTRQGPRAGIIISVAAVALLCAFVVAGWIGTFFN